MNSKIKFKGKVITHLAYPIVLGMLMLLVGIYEYTNNMTIGLILMAASATLIIVTIVMYFFHKPVIMHDLINFAVDYAKIQKELLRDLAVPYGLVDVEGNMLWINKELEAIIQCDEVKGKNINEIFSQLSADDFKTVEDSKELNISYQDRA